MLKWKFVSTVEFLIVHVFYLNLEVSSYFYEHQNVRKQIGGWTNRPINRNHEYTFKILIMMMMILKTIEIKLIQLH